MTSVPKGIVHRRILLHIGYITLGALLAMSATSAPDQQLEITLLVYDNPIKAEVAHTDAARMQGLAYRRMLPESRGMFFIFPEPALYGIWMKDAFIPLSVAFLDEQGFIINIAKMEPNTLTRHFADRPAKYALEVNRGWFAERGIKPGMHVLGIENTPPAR